MPAWVLKIAAATATMLAVIGSAGFVSGHVKRQDAPLRPAVLSPAVRPTSVDPVTSTRAS